MTTPALFVWIVLGIAVQLAVFAGFMFRKHWQGYRSLRQQTDELALAPQSPPPEESVEPAPPAWTGLRPFRVERKVVEDEAGTIRSFYLVPDDRRPLPSFQPGQFLTFSLELPAPGGAAAIVRCYSLSAAPAPDHFRISVKRVPAPPGRDVPPGRSSGFLHDHVGVGDVLHVRAPAGHFHIDHGDVPVVLIAGGIGITPLLSMLDWCVAEQPGREVWLFYGVRNAGEVIMRSHLDALAAAHPGFQLRLCFSAPPPGFAESATCHRGRVDVDLLRMQLPLKPYRYYLCGPPQMMESLVPALEDWGVPPSRIHFEAFGPASVKRRQAAPAPAVATSARAATPALAVTFSRTGKTVAWQEEGGSLLELAEANGIPIPSGCRAGGCGTCQTTINAGEVAYRQAPDYDPEPGTCLMCVCTPRTSVALEA